MILQELTTLAKILGRYKTWTLSTIATYSVNDGKLFARINAGRGCNVITAEKCKKWFSDNWPDDLDWPPHIDRPIQNSEAA